MDRLDLGENATDLLNRLRNGHQKLGFSEIGRTGVASIFTSRLRRWALSRKIAEIFFSVGFLLTLR